MSKVMKSFICRFLEVSNQYRPHWYRYWCQCKSGVSLAI